MISACVRAQGQVRIVSATEACTAGEQRLQWPASAPAAGALRVVDANGTFVGRYGDSATTIIASGSDWIAVLLTAEGVRQSSGGPVFYYNTACPNASDRTVLHGTVGHLGFTDPELVKFALGMPAAPKLVYYAGAEDPAFVAIAIEYDEQTPTGSQRICYTFDQPITAFRYAAAKTFDLGVFTPPFRVVQ